MGTFNKEALPEPVSYYESQDLRLDGPGKWKTTECRAHGGSDSMRINTVTGGYICMACGVKGGDVLAYHMAAHDMEFVEAAKALGAWIDDGKPGAPQRPKPLPAGQALQVLALESTLAAVAAGNIANGIKLTDTDLARLYVAAQRIQTIMGAFA